MMMKNQTTRWFIRAQRQTDRQTQPWYCMYICSLWCPFFFVHQHIWWRPQHDDEGGKIRYKLNSAVQPPSQVSSSFLSRSVVTTDRWSLLGHFSLQSPLKSVRGSSQIEISTPSITEPRASQRNLMLLFWRQFSAIFEMPFEIYLLFNLAGHAERSRTS